MIPVTAIVPVRNGARTLGRCLASIRAAAAPGQVCVIVADNGSSDATPAIARDHGATLLPLPGLRVSAVRNRAACAATTPALAFIDADHELPPGWFRAAAECLAGPDVGAAGAEYRPPPSGTWVQTTYDLLRRHDPVRREAGWLPSGNLLVRHSAFAAIGGFDERLETCEDVDFCRRLTAAGYRLVADPRLVSIHLGDPATLRAVFFGEMWRGRDNLRVTLRRPLVLRSVLSALQPLATVGIIAAALAAAAMRPQQAPAWLVGGGALVVAASLPRVAQMVRRARAWNAGMLVRSWAVAVAFDLGRALALVVRARHGTRRQDSAGFLPAPRT